MRLILNCVDRGFRTSEAYVFEYRAIQDDLALMESQSVDEILQDPRLGVHVDLGDEFPRREALRATMASLMASNKTLSIRSIRRIVDAYAEYYPLSPEGLREPGAAGIAPTPLLLFHMLLQYIGCRVSLAREGEVVSAATE